MGDRIGSPRRPSPYFFENHPLDKIPKTPDVQTTLLPSQLDDVLELDELWSFVGKKITNAGFGWPYVIALDKSSLIGLVIGHRLVLCNYGDDCPSLHVYL